MLDEFYRVCLEKGLVETDSGNVSIPDPEWLHATLFQNVRLPRFKRLVNIRLVARNQDSSIGTHAPPSPPAIDSENPTALAQALAAAWNEIGRQANNRCDVLITEMIPSHSRGRAQINYEESPDSITTTSRDDADESFSLPSLARWKRPNETLPHYARRLQMLLRGVRNTFGSGEWLVDWRDDGHICYLTGITPIDPPASAGETPP